MLALTRPLMAALLAVSVADTAAAQTRLPPVNLWTPENLTGGIDMGESGCGAEQLQSMLGHPAELVEALPSLRLVRVFTPDMPFGTMDFIPHRLNITVGESGLIERVACG